MNQFTDLQRPDENSTDTTDTSTPDEQTYPDVNSTVEDLTADNIKGGQYVEPTNYGKEVSTPERPQGIIEQFLDKVAETRARSEGLYAREDSAKRLSQFHEKLQLSNAQELQFEARKEAYKNTMAMQDSKNKNLKLQSDLFKRMASVSQNPQEKEFLLALSTGIDAKVAKLLKPGTDKPANSLEQSWMREAQEKFPNDLEKQNKYVETKKLEMDQKKGLSPEEDIDAMAQAIVDGKMSIAQVPKKGKSYNAVVKKVLEKDPNMNFAQNQLNFNAIGKFMSTENSQSQVTKIQLLGSVGKHLDVLENLSAKYKRYDNIPINALSNKIGRYAGNTMVTAFQTAATEATAQLAQIFSGSAVTTDTKYLDAKKALDVNQTFGQVRANIKILRDFLKNRHEALTTFSPITLAGGQTFGTKPTPQPGINPDITFTPGSRKNDTVLDKETANGLLHKSKGDVKAALKEAKRLGFKTDWMGRKIQ